MPGIAARPDSAGSSARRILFEDRGEGRIVKAWISADDMQVWMDCDVLGKVWPQASEDALVDLLARHGVIGGLDRAVLGRVVAAAREGRGLTGQVVARGTRPEPGVDGVLEFIVRPSGESARFEHDEASGRIDYRETNLVQNVLSGEPVAIEIAPRPGRDGQNVFGRAAKAAQGNPAKYKLGGGVRFDKSSHQVMATMDGRVVWELGVVSVSRTYHVRGSVDYSVGNIAFVGEVIIDGEVLDGFSVRSGGSLLVGGNVGACRLDSDGDLVVKGTVFGKGKALLRAKGQLRARVLNECRAEAAGALSVEREAVGSTLLTNGRLFMPEGVLVGGSVSALAGVDVSALGSALGVMTSVSAGTDYHLARRQAEVDSRLAAIDASVEKISGFLGPLLADRRRMTQLLRRRRTDMEKMVKTLRELRAERAELIKQMEEMASAAGHGAVRQINVRRQMHPGALLELGALRHRVRKTAAGPLSVLEDRARGALRTVEFRDLPGAADK